MSKYVVKRLLFLIPTILGVTLIIFSIMSITPGDPGRAILGPSVPQADVDEYNHKLGYDLPFIQKYINYIKNMVLFKNFGISYFTKQPVFEEIWPRFLVTIKLAFIGVALSAVIGVPTGIYAAVKQYKPFDTISSLAAFFLAAIPAFVLGMMLLLIFAMKLNWLPSHGINTFKHYIMPAIMISIPPAAQNMRFTKSSMLETIRQDYVRTARAKGASGVLIAGAVVAEKLFSIPGIGSLIVDRITYKDEPIIIAGTILISIVFNLIMLLVDILYAFIDPRIRSKYTRNYIGR